MTYTVTLRMLPHAIPGILRLKAVLKRLGRDHGYQCIDYRAQPGEPGRDPAVGGVKEHPVSGPRAARQLPLEIARPVKTGSHSHRVARSAIDPALNLAEISTRHDCSRGNQTNEEITPDRVSAQTAGQPAEMRWHVGYTSDRGTGGPSHQSRSFAW